MDPQIEISQLKEELANKLELIEVKEERISTLRQHISLLEERLDIKSGKKPRAKHLRIV